MKFLKIWILLLASYSLLSACNEGGGTSVEQSYIPDVEINCSPIQSTDCAALNNGKAIFVGIHSDLSTDCEAYLLSLSPVALLKGFDAYGETVARYSAGRLGGFVTTWLNAQGVDISNLDRESTYRLCAFIDINGNNQLDSGEPFGDGQMIPGSGSSVAISDWTDAQ